MGNVQLSLDAKSLVGPAKGAELSLVPGSKIKIETIQSIIRTENAKGRLLCVPSSKEKKNVITISVTKNTQPTGLIKKRLRLLFTPLAKSKSRRTYFFVREAGWGG